MIGSLLENIPLSQRNPEDIGKLRDGLNRSFRALAIGAAYYTVQEETRLHDTYDCLRFLDEVLFDLEHVEVPGSPKKKNSSNP